VALVGAAGAPRVRRERGPRLVVAGGAEAVVVAVAVAALDDDATRLSTTPAGQSGAGASQANGGPAPTPTPPLVGPVEAPLAEGTANDGGAWQLFLNGPSNDLCLGAEGTGVCAGVPFGAPPYRPVHFTGLRAPAFVFGRVEAGVTRVSVVLGGGETLAPQPVIAANGGPYYVVQLPDGSSPAAVVGHRADGSSVRHDR
jgi:hypothetical protein